MEYPKISIVTPNYNGARFLEETILSVTDQSYPNLEYIIVDGESTDDSVKIIKKYEKYISFWISEKDEGIYHALQKGFEKSTGTIMGWINSDDILHKNSLFEIAFIFENNKKVKWIQGKPNVIDENGKIIYEREARYKKEPFLLNRFYDWVFIQQESTFWNRDLWNKSGAFIDTTYKYAGDFELWMRFFLYDKQYITNKKLGAFRVRSGQISAENKEAYLFECKNVIRYFVKKSNIGLKVKLIFFKKIERYLKKYKKVYQLIPFYSEHDHRRIIP